MAKLTSAPIPAFPRPLEWSFDGQRFSDFHLSAFWVLRHHVASRCPVDWQYLEREIRAGRTGSVRLDAEHELYLRVQPETRRISSCQR